MRPRIEKRGWWDVSCVGYAVYCVHPSAKLVALTKRIWPNAAWSITSHAGELGSWPTGQKGESVPVRYAECVWAEGRVKARGYQALFKPGRDKAIWDGTNRDGHNEKYPLATYYDKPEEMIMKGHDGLGLLLSDFLPIPQTGKAGRFYFLGANAGGVLGDSTKSLLAAGADGPIASERYEVFREGTELCEAIIFLQRALDAKTVGGELAERVNKYLDERGNAKVNGWKPGRIVMNRRLLELAAEVEAAAKTDGHK